MAAHREQSRWNTGDVVLLLSPVVMIFYLVLVGTLLDSLQGNWIWVPFVLLYWLAISVTVKFLSPPSFMTELFRKPSGSWYWSLIAMLVGVGGFSYVLENLDYYRVPGYVLAGIAFSLVNPLFEEIYWRKLFIDRLPRHRYAVAHRAFHQIVSETSFDLRGLGSVGQPRVATETNFSTQAASRRA